MTMDRTTAASRIDHLVVIRESSRHNRELMEGMILTTLSKVLDLPGARELVQAGLDVFDNPNEYSAVSKRVGRSTIRLIERDGVLYFYSMGSAAAKDLADGNAFARELVGAIRHYRPRTVWADSLTRLVRSTQAIGELLVPSQLSCSVSGVVGFDGSGVVRYRSWGRCQLMFSWGRIRLYPWRKVSTWEARSSAPSMSWR